MADAATKKVLTDAKDVLVDRLKSNATVSLKLGVGVTVVTFGVLTTILAASAVIGAGQGVVDGIKTVAKNQ